MTAAQAAGLLTPELQAALRGLSLRARHPQPGQNLGQHASPQRGAGREFAQYRAYEPGDEPRRIDWKLYARSDRLFVREAERDSPLTLWLLLDATASMAQTDRDAPQSAKWLRAQRLAAAMAQLAVAGGDRCGLAVLSGDRLQLQPAGSGLRQRDRLWLALAGIQPAGRWPNEDALRPLWSQIEPAALVLSMSDGFDEAWAPLLSRLAAAGREPRAIQLLCREEVEFPYRERLRFREPETGEERSLDAETARADYLRRFEAAQQALHTQLAAAGVPLAVHVGADALAAPLQAVFGQRAAR